MAFATVHGIGPLSKGTGPLNPALPGGVLAGMLLYCLIETAANEATAASGWTHVADSPVNNATGTRLSLLKRYATGSGDAPTIVDSGDHQSARVIAFNGMHASAAEDVTNSGTGDTTAVSIPGDTTTDTDRLVCVFATHGLDKLSSHFASWANADLANIVEHFDDSHDSGTGGGIAFVTGEKAVAGAFGATTAIGAEDGPWAGLVVAMIPGATIEESSEEPSEEPSEESEEDNEVPYGEGIGIDTWQWATPEDDPADREPIDYYLVWQYMDQGAEDQNKLVDKIRITAKGSDLQVQIHAASPGDEIDKDDIEDGVNARATVSFSDSGEVTRYAERPVKVKNLSIWTARYSGVDDGQSDIRDRLDELIIGGRTHGTAK